MTAGQLRAAIATVGGHSQVLFVLTDGTILAPGQVEIHSHLDDSGKPTVVIPLSIPNPPKPDKIAKILTKGSGV